MKLISKDGYGTFEREGSIYFNNVRIFYKYDFKQVTEITKEDYIIQKYGEENQYWKKPFDKMVKLKNGDFITTFYQDNEIRLHHPNGKVKKIIEKINAPFRLGIYGMSIDRNENLWIAVPVEHYVGKFNIDTEEELFSINGKDLEPTIFDHPENVIVINDFAYVSDMGNKRIAKINITNYEITDYKKVDEQIYYFNQINGRNIYQLNSGIYVE